MEHCLDIGDAAKPSIERQSELKLHKDESGGRLPGYQRTGPVRLREASQRPGLDCRLSAAAV